VVLFFHKDKTWAKFKPYLVTAISPDYTVHQLIQMLQIKLIWKGYLKEENASFYINVGEMQITAAFGTDKLT
jgi:hypothetical protein